MLKRRSKVCSISKGMTLQEGKTTLGELIDKKHFPEDKKSFSGEWSLFANYGAYKKETRFALWKLHQD